MDGTKQLVSKIVALDDTPEKDQFVVWVLRAVNQEVEGKQRIKILDYGDEPPSSAEQATVKYDTFLQELGTKVRHCENINSVRYEAPYNALRSSH